MNQTLKLGYTSKKLLLMGLLGIICGVLLVVYQSEATVNFIDLITGYFVITALWGLISKLWKKDETESTFKLVLQFLIANIIGFLNYATDVPTHFIVRVLGIYQLFIAFISLVTWYLYRQNKIPKRSRFLIDAIIYALFGSSAFITPGDDANIQFLIVGIYLIFLGLSYVRDGLFFYSDAGHQNLKRRFRINLPIVLVALIPHSTLKKINNTLQETPSTTDLTAATLYNQKKEEHPDLEVFVHVTESGFGAMGHVDLCYNNTVISYGSYDPNSEKLGGALGDGVLFKVDRDKYIDFCKQESHKTLFGFGLRLNSEQRKQVEARLAEIDKLLIDWTPSEFTKSNKVMYSYKLQQETGATLFKFKESRFKSYFVLSTNCVLLADSIIGQAGTDILSAKGFISPGTYQDFLTKEYNRPNSIVITQSVY